LRPLDILPRLSSWFEEYTRRFHSHDPAVQESMDLKTEHTRRVCEAARDIGRSLDLSEEDLALAEACALLHDIGRFEQYRRYRTFADHRSEDHADLGVRVIRETQVLKDMDPVAADMILRAVQYHNRASLPEGEPDRFLLFLKLLRDADKVDIWRVVTDYYRHAEEHPSRTIELDLPDTDRVSDAVYEALMNGRLVRMADLETLNDFKLLQIGWVYDLNFHRAFQIVREKKYLEAIRAALPQGSPRVTEIYERARAYLEKRAPSA